jgi:tetratricopeptide (TPR) repeat protein
MNKNIIQLLFGAGVLLLITVIGLRQIVDVDIWWHICIGNEFLHRFATPDFSQFYSTPVNPNILDLRYTWLGDILFALVYRFSGDLGLQVFRLTMMGFSAAMLWDIHRRNPSSFLYFMLILFFLTTYQIQLVRNALFSLPLFTALYWIWWKVRFQEQKNFIWWIPVLLTLWSFLHGTFLIGDALFFFMFLGEVYQWLSERNPARRSLVPHKKAGHKKVAEDVPDPMTCASGFDSLRRMAIALVLSFIGTVSFNTYAILMLRRMMGQQWLLIIASGVIVLASVFLVPSVFSRIVKFKGILLLLMRVSIVLVLIAFIGWMTYRVRNALLRNDFGPGKALQTVLNSLVFKFKRNGFISEDFRSPWDHLDEIYILLSFLSGLFILLLLVFKKSVPRGLVFSYFPLLILATGYKRTAGYLGMFSVLFILIIFKNLDRPWEKTWLKFCNVLIMLFLVFAVFFSPGKAGLWDNHVAGFGRVPWFSEDCMGYVFEKEGNAPVFTNVTNGGYLLLKWFPRKKVFVDGFFAPHKGKTFKIYRRLLRQHNPNRLFKKYSIRRAIVTHRDLAWLSLFSSSRSWYPECIDEGMIVFLYQPEWERAPSPEVLVSSGDFSSLPPYYRTLCADRLLEIPTALIAKGRVQQAVAFVDENVDIMALARNSADEFAVKQLDQNMKTALETYHGQDNILLYDEFQLQNGLNHGDLLQVRESAARIWKAQPGIEIGFQLADSCLGNGDLRQSMKVLKEVQRMVLEEPSHEGRNNTLITLWKRLVKTYEDKLEYEAAIDVYFAMSQLKPGLIDDPKILQTGLVFVQNLLRASDPGRAFQLLVFLRGKFPESPYVLSHLAAVVFKHYSELGESPDQAESFAFQAVELGERQSVSELDVLYGNLSDILRAEDKLEESELYLKKAREAAPPERKSRYDNKH